MRDTPKLSVIIVSWNVETLLKQALTSVYRSWGDEPGLEVIVVDNASVDQSVAMVRREFPYTILIANARNTGYPAGCNKGIGQASGEYLLILNPDTEAINRSLHTVIEYMDTHPDVGIAGPLLKYPDGTHQSSRRRFPNLPILFLESTWFQCLAPRKLLNKFFMNDQPDNSVQEVDWITGAAMFARREVIEEVGPFDEGYFMYSEEVDWCQRIRKKGWRVIFIPEAIIVHHEGKSSEQVAEKRHIYFQTSKIRYTRMYHGNFAAWLLYHWLRMQYVLQILVEGIKWIFGHKRQLRHDRIKAYASILESRFR
ncbi:MAG: glycosyltransferase family 2 protein [Anaerolineae bacterium]|nr:glycosyltransferase family 2 protein [Anaerolineae bacterium]